MGYDLGRKILLLCPIYILFMLNECFCVVLMSTHALYILLLSQVRADLRTTSALNSFNTFFLSNSYPILQAWLPLHGNTGVFNCTLILNA